MFLLLATWASVQHWYRSIDHFDLLVHFLTPGSMAAAVFFVLADWRLFPRPRRRHPGIRPGATALWVTTVGVTAAVLWEYYELVVEQIAPQMMHVGYVDTVLDLLAGMLGSVLAGWLVHLWAQHVEAATSPTRETTTKGR